jgi:hypothetical protein
VTVANSYLQFSEVLANLTEHEEAWLKDQLQIVVGFGEAEYPEDDVPAELAGTDADYHGVRFLRDKPDTDRYIDPKTIGFEYEFDDDASPTEPNWGRHLWLYAEEYGDVDSAAWLVQKFLKQFRPDRCWSITYATTCSKPRVGEFGGGAVFVTADEIFWENAYDFVDKQKQLFEEKLARKQEPT